MREPTEAPASLPKRIGWLILIWTASVLALGAVALAFRFLMNLAGLTA
ncbi:DUF2474 domain-containing protein [Mesorhizobium sp. 1B3]